MVHQTFYMIYVEGERPPTYKHTTLDAAITEAKRLSRLLDKQAYILEAKMALSLGNFRIDHYADIPNLQPAVSPSDNPDDLPF